MKNRISIIAAVILCSSQLLTAQAAVVVENGNYFIGAIDLIHPTRVPGKFPVKIQRHYNSRSQYEGLFGVGWSSEIESYLIPQLDGSIVIQEAGGGAKTRYTAESYTAATLAQQVDKIVALRTKKGTLNNAAAYKEKLLKDANFRDEETRALDAFVLPADGTKFFTSQRGEKQAVTFFMPKKKQGAPDTQVGFIREYGDGRQEVFSQKGDVVDKAVGSGGRRILKGVYKVTRLYDPLKKVSLFYTYNTKGQLTTITDKEGQTIRLSYNSDDKISQAEDSTGKKSTYKYCDSSAYDAKKGCGKYDLVEVRTADSKIFFRYQYDVVHNLTQLQLYDGKVEKIGYYPYQEGGGVKSFLSRDGILNEYKYWKDPKDPQGQFKTEIRVTLPDKRVLESSFEYHDKVRADGSRYRYRMVASENGRKVDTIYNECCGQPLQIVDGKGETKFEYVPGSGLLKEKVTASEVTRWEYHQSPRLKGKITKITVAPTGANKKAVSTVYEYDESNGNLKRARTTDGRGVALGYDKLGRVEAMIDQDKRKIVFKYNEASKPMEIIQEGVGSIQVNYGRDGRIAGVKSKGGRQISMSVAAAFQNLVDIVKPAGIDPL